QPDATISSRRCWARSAAIAPSPTAPATRLIQPCRTSPAANTLGTLVSRMRRSGLDEDHERFGEYPVVLHRVSRRLSLHRSHDGIHVRNIHNQADTGAVVRVDERPNVRHAEWAEELFTLGRREPVV